MNGRRLLSRWGLPDVTGNGRFVGANVLDSLGNGLVLAFTVVYFSATTSLPLGAIGAALSLGQLLALPTPIVAGPLIDRLGPRKVVLAANVISAAGFTGFLFADAAWKIVLVQLVVQAGSSIYWTSSRALVMLAAARHGDRSRWFGFIGALRNIGAGFGSAVASVAVALGSGTGVRGLVLVNALTFVVAAWLVATWRPGAATGAERPDPPGDSGADADADKTTLGGYAQVLRDGRYLRLVLANLSFVLAASVLPVLLAVYTTEVLGAGAWLIGVCVVGNMVLVAVAQTLVARWAERHRPTRVLALAAMVNAAAFAVFALLLALPGPAVAVGLLTAMLIFTFAEMLSLPPSNELSVSLAPEHIRGRYLGAFQLSWTLGNALAPALLTLLLSQGPARPWVLLGGLNVLAVPLVLGLDRRPRTRTGTGARAGNPAVPVSPSVEEAAS
ncbi:MFS transporter [Streptomyces sp. NPDC059564]|uniref:MFS transporter n=1 Tax=Streptomyces sp. NPDC059564 TaxID=3346865 RepID=UPI0036CF2C13